VNTYLLTNYVVKYVLHDIIILFSRLLTTVFLPEAATNGRVEPTPYSRVPSSSFVKTILIFLTTAHNFLSF
jgi:hypothetical protein